MNFQALRDKLVELASHQLPGNFRPHAEQIIDLHLRDDTLSMPNMNQSKLESIKNLILDGASISDLLENLVLEESSTKRGMFRVMLRTHLNRAGINDVSMGGDNKTLSPRVLEPFESLDFDSSIRDLSAQITVLEKFEQYASAHRAVPDDARRFSESAYSSVVCITNFARAENDLLRYSSARSLVKDSGCSLNWARFLLGVLTGLMFLQQANWSPYNDANDSELDAAKIIELISICQSSIAEYGTALAGSFYADLGGGRFVKDDTHVRMCVEALGIVNRGPEQRVAWVIEEADRLGVAPRILDKIFYTAGSGKLNLVGVEFENPRAAKREFIDFLSKLSH